MDMHRHSIVPRPRPGHAVKHRGESRILPQWIRHNSPALRLSANRRASVAAILALAVAAATVTILGWRLTAASDQAFDTTPVATTTAAMPQRHLRLTATSSPPTGTLYVATGCTSCGASDEALVAYHGVSGILQRTVLVETGRGILDGWTANTFGADADGSLLTVVACDQSDCTQAAESSDPSTWKVFTSQDAGVTWNMGFERETGYVRVSDITEGHVAIVTSDAVDGTGLLRFWIVNAADNHSVEVFPPVGIDAIELYLPTSRRPLWLLRNRTGLTQQDGTLLILHNAGISDYRIAAVDTSSSGDTTSVTWLTGNNSYMTEIAGSSTTYHYSADGPLHLYTPDHGVANISSQIFPGGERFSYPAQVNLQTNQLTAYTVSDFSTAPGRFRFLAFKLP